MNEEDTPSGAFGLENV